MKPTKWLPVLMVPLLLMAMGCSDDDDNGVGPITPAQALETALHNTTAGMEYFYSETQGGFEQFTDVTYNNLNCKGCHAGPDDCEVCHVGGVDASPTPPNSSCLDVCHSRQKTEQGGGNGLYADHHLKQGFNCADCHSSTQVHGDGNSYVSLLENPNNASCTQPGCHESVPSNAYHNAHGPDDFECQACHAKATMSCYNCHFEEELATPSRKHFYKPPYGGWKFLVREESTGKITTGNMMPLRYQDSQFYVIAPYYAHTIASGDEMGSMTCGTCHSSNAVEEYRASGTMTLSDWNAGTETMDYMEGVIPIPTNWMSSLKLDFLNWTGPEDTDWEFDSDQADSYHMLFAEPIDVNQLPDM